MIITESEDEDELINHDGCVVLTPNALHIGKVTLKPETHPEETTGQTSGPIVPQIVP